ncbi:arylsulfatase [Carboxylicivirga sp. N1Y90]|uniref:arylsulfatase n=1 Tax=Carboxylicivirga fragile TaxID=3417571 RepID=UPI003D34F9C0|nr:arylsulfatase [Marinilabiliaceae bacterium N1Y90]
MTASYFLKFILLSLMAVSITACSNVKKEQSPNIIYILADDLGYGDLSCYGQTRFSTPNIDKLAEQGMLFTQHYSGSTVCAPSRSALMTGQHTGHTYIRGNKERRPEGQHPLNNESFTIAEMLKLKGYATGAFGKWGLGYPGSEGDPNQQGFDTFFGYNCQMLGHHYYPYFLRDNQDSLVLEANVGLNCEVYAPELIHDKTLDFIEQHKDEPFFCYVPSIIPHAELLAPEKYMAMYRGKFEPEHHYKGLDEGPGFRKGGYCSQVESHAAFAAMVHLLDEQVGEIVAKVEELGIAKNTLIIFTSDNGPHKEGGAQPDYFNSNGQLKGYKRDLYEGGIRVPFIASWPGMIKKGTVSHHISAFWDMMPTFAELTGYESKTNDGISMLPTLLSKGEQRQHNYLYWEFHELGGRQAIRNRKWKAVKYNVLNPDKTSLELYNLEDDISESFNIASQHPDIIKNMKILFEEAHTESAVFDFKP